MASGLSHLSVGNLNVDVYMVVPRLPGGDEAVTAEDSYIGPGGAAANYAVAASRAGHRASLLAHTGHLAVDLGLLSSLSRIGVDTSLVSVHENEMPGIVLVLVGSRGERAMVKLPGANRLLRGDEAAGLRFTVVHVASVGSAIAARVFSSVEAQLRTYDPGGSAYKEGLEGVKRVRGLVDVLYLNKAEYRALTGADPDPSGASKLAALVGARLLVVKLGGEGALAVEPGGGALRVGALRVKPLDTTGAGDVFDAYMNAWLAEGSSVEEALRAASTAAGLKVERRGAQSAPSREEVEERLRGGEAPRVWRI